MLTVTLNPALDVCAHIPVVEPDRKMHCAGVMVEPGGGGINGARVAVRLGVATTASAHTSGTGLCEAHEVERLLPHVNVTTLPS